MLIGDEIRPADAHLYLTKREAANLIRVSTRTINAYIARGLLTVRYTCAGHPRILASSLWRDPGLAHSAGTPDHANENGRFWPHPVGS